jgi:hypothetical protein
VFDVVKEAVVVSVVDVQQDKTELLRIILDAIDRGKFLQVTILWFLISSPWIFATGMAWWLRWKNTRLYERMCHDKDREIDRQAKRIKDLENLTLKTKR